MNKNVCDGCGQLTTTKFVYGCGWWPDPGAFAAFVTFCSKCKREAKRIKLLHSDGFVNNDPRIWGTIDISEIITKKRDIKTIKQA